MKSYRGRYVSYGANPFSHYDPGPIDTLGDRMWTDYSGFGPVQVYTRSQKKVGPELECLYTSIDGYRLTFSSHIGGEQVLLLGDFIFLYGSSDNMYSDIRYTYLLLDSKSLSREQINDREEMISVNLDMTQQITKKQHVNQSGEHISPYTNGGSAKSQLVDWNDAQLGAFLEANPNTATCGGAVRIKITWKKYRWLFPHPDGVQAAWDHLQNTTEEDDWLALMNLIDDAHPIERSRVLESFESK